MTSTFDRVLDQVGDAVVSGTLAAGSRRSVDDMVAWTGASRSIVREAVRVLVALGLLTARRRVGVTVLDADRWDVLDPRVVRWRLRGPDGDRVAVELRELRAAVEPAAAAAAARRAALDACADRREALRTTADELAAAATRDDRPDFVTADVRLHALVLDLSGNTLYRRLHRVVGQVLLERGSIRPDRHDVGLHLALAGAVVDGRPDDAAAAMRAIVDRT
ncbi:MULTISPECIES: FadR/GntR family transcriptional regulator [Curtobacterium]|uniref:FCD domain-containing protein n=1 Tax=Curtobacterium flaccumfaciens pv. flaccumfaciens TaxID=138532 RepID=A0A9Q2ZQC5_9MICO|nr:MULTISPECIES: FCD domain-containing protein [Curtobacterium]MBF4596542.1 FadR family transcriptional regulator [Curtobacterium sp. VKM Ac-1796]MBF4612858.1 FadR family transcriptional regulator [Curtobacterium sp. VKM Ac-2889]MBT1541029.1 FCD domain-containing protein [Curtobacterium flaccumfaciens pv. flaccumfaciens]MDD1385533.1 FCD domain-containing protein [Curtobacterium flaccumfaciens pv. poinsettiae]MDQ0540396.1 DNA-binding FadR family transcriptional regulator [Curtobacterium flaccum